MIQNTIRGNHYLSYFLIKWIFKPINKARKLIHNYSSALVALLMRKCDHLRYNISMVVIVGNFVQEGSWLQNKGWQDYTGQVHTWPNLQNNRRVISKRNITKKHNFYLYYYCKVFSFFQKLLSIKEISQILKLNLILLLKIP